MAGTILVGAQWLDRSTLGIARTHDDKPDLTAPALRGPDGKPGRRIPGEESRPLVPQSQTLFDGLGLGYQFIVDDKGVAASVVEIHVTGPYRFPRQP